MNIIIIYKLYYGSSLIIFGLILKFCWSETYKCHICPKELKDWAVRALYEGKCKSWFDIHVYFCKPNYVNRAQRSFCLIPVCVCVHRVSSRIRILSSLFVILFVFAVTTALVKVDTSNYRMGFLVVTLVSVAVVSGASNIFYGSIFGISGHFPMRISQALISGRDLIQVKLEMSFVDTGVFY